MERSERWAEEEWKGVTDGLKMNGNLHFEALPCGTGTTQQRSTNEKTKQNKKFLKGRGKGGEGGHVFMVKDGGNHCVCVYGARGGGGGV